MNPKSRSGRPPRVTWRHMLAWGTGLAVLVALAVCVGQSNVRLVFDDRDALQRWVSDLGPWGPLAIIGTEIVQVLAAPVPGQIVGVVAGYLYGPLWGTLWCMVGLTCGSLLAMGLARRLGRPLVERLASPDLLARVDAYVQRRGAVTLLLIFLLPFLPDDICCFIAGLTSLPLRDMLILAVIGRTPGVLVSTLVGAQAHRLTMWQVAAIGGASAGVAFLFARFQQPLERAMLALLERLSAIQR